MKLLIDEREQKNKTTICNGLFIQAYNKYRKNGVNRVNLNVKLALEMILIPAGISSDAIITVDNPRLTIGTLYIIITGSKENPNVYIQLFLAYYS